MFQKWYNKIKQREKGEMKMREPQKTTLSEMNWHGKNFAVWREKSFVDVDMGNEDLSGKSFYRINFTNCDLRGCDLAYADFRECKFENTPMGFANFELTKFDNCQFNECDFSYTKMKQMQIRDSKFNNCNLENTLWTGRFCDTLFLNCNMESFKMHEVNTTGTIIRNCNLEGAEITTWENGGRNHIENCVLNKDTNIVGFTLRNGGNKNE